MLKYLLLFTINLFAINSVICKNSDTSIVYLRYTNTISVKVQTLDSADYFMMILPPDSADSRFNIIQYYKNGKPKLIGKSNSGINQLKNGRFILTGDCITYYENGRRESISQYKEGYKDGLEYLYYDYGALHCVMKHIFGSSIAYDETLKWDCYDAKGNMISKDGNGKWIIYDGSKNVNLEGQVINGYMEGDWHGGEMHHDSIKYIYKYKKSVIISSTGYDKTGKPYPFNKEIELANYKGGLTAFIQIFRNKLNIPDGLDGKKMSIDTTHISFIVEKDGHIDDFETLGNVGQELSNALAKAISKCPDWAPSKYYGIPYRTKIMLPLKYLHGYADSKFYKEEVFFNEKILEF